MGVIQRQGSKQAIVRMAGVLIGFLSVLLIYPLDLKSYGHAQFLLSSAMVITPVLGLGFSQSAVKYFAVYDKYVEGKRGFFKLLLLLHSSTLLFFLSIYLVLRSWLHNSLAAWDIDISLLIQNELIIVGIAIVLMVYGTLTMYISNFGRIVIPSIIMDLSYKLFLPLVIILSYLGYIRYENVGPLILCFYVIALFVLLIYARKLDILGGSVNYSFLGKSRWKDMFKFSLFSALSGLGAILAFRIDAVMVAELLDEMSCGIYFNILVIAMIIDIPNQALGKIAAPIISKYWVDNNTNEIQEVYSKASLNALIIGAFIFLGILFNIHDIFQLSSNPEAFIGATQIFMILGMAKLIDAATGINSQILIYSKFYKYNLMFLLILGVLNIVLNIYFIRNYGLNGAALATFISLTIYNALKFFFIKRYMGLNPFSKDTVIVVGIISLVCALLYALPAFDNAIISIVFRSVVLGVVFGSAIYFTKVSTDLNALIRKYIKFVIR